MIECSFFYTAREYATRPHSTLHAQTVLLQRGKVPNTYTQMETSYKLAVVQDPTSSRQHSASRCRQRRNLWPQGRRLRPSWTVQPLPCRLSQLRWPWNPPSRFTLAVPCLLPCVLLFLEHAVAPAHLQCNYRVAIFR